MKKQKRIGIKEWIWELYKTEGPTLQEILNSKPESMKKDKTFRIRREESDQILHREEPKHVNRSYRATLQWTPQKGWEEIKDYVEISRREEHNG